MCALESQPSLKNTPPPFFLPSLPLNQQTDQAPPFRPSPPSILVFREASH